MYPALLLGRRKSRLYSYQGENKQLLAPTLWVQMIYPVRSNSGWKGNKYEGSRQGPGPCEVQKDLLEQRGREIRVENFPGVGMYQTSFLSLGRKKLVERNSRSSEYFPDPENEKQAELNQGESPNIS